MLVKLSQISPYIIPPLISFLISIALAAIAFIKGRYKKEGFYLALIVFWWSLLLPVFILGHVIDDELLLLRIERLTHFFYVYLPALILLFIHSIYGLKRTVLTVGSFLLSFCLSLTTLTDYYFYGLQKFEWGYIARGGPAFEAFSVYGGFSIAYIFVRSFRRLRTEKDPLERLKIKYINLSFLFIAVLTLLNIPAIMGYDFYPVGNLMFVPLSILSYGILKHQLIDIKNIFQITIPRLLISSLIIVFNLLVYYFIWTYFQKIDPIVLFFLFVIWFFSNHRYVLNIHPQIQEVFARRTIVLENEKKYKISHLKDVDLKQIEARLSELMLEEKIYCDEDLNLARLAGMLELTTHQLSEYLNQHLKKSFYLFLNEYRVEEAKRLLLKHQDRSILSIGLSVGFNSRSVFNSAFSKIAKLTPNQYRKSNKA